MHVGFENVNSQIQEFGQISTRNAQKQTFSSQNNKNYEEVKNIANVNANNNAIETAVKNLKVALAKESDQWKQWAFLGLHQGWDVATADDRDRVSNWIFDLAEKFGLTLSTVSLSSAMLDRVLYTTTVQTRYLKCAALACLFIGSKIAEETEDAPLCRELVREAGCLFSVGELVRMERVLLQRLKWDLNFVTLDTFLQLMLVIVAPEHIRLDLFVQFGDLIKTITCSYRLTVAYKPSLLALCVLSLTLGRLRSANRASIISRLKRLMDISDEKFFDCYNNVAQNWRQKFGGGSENDENSRQNAGISGHVTSPNVHSLSDHVTSPGSDHVTSKRKGRKRQRQKSKSFSYQNQEEFFTAAIRKMTTTKAKTNENPVNIDEIYDSVHFLYDTGLQ